MWNLQALAAKAQEAAARIEAQLDDSVGIKDDGGASGGGMLSTSASAPLSAVDENHNINDDSYLNAEDDDFFSDDHDNAAVTSSVVQESKEAISSPSFDNDNNKADDFGQDKVDDDENEASYYIQFPLLFKSIQITVPLPIEGGGRLSLNQSSSISIMSFISGDVLPSFFSLQKVFLYHLYSR